MMSLIRVKTERPTMSFKLYILILSGVAYGAFKVIDNFLRGLGLG